MRKKGKNGKNAKMHIPIFFLQETIFHSYRSYLLTILTILTILTTILTNKKNVKILDLASFEK
jgi:hypothetical protein